MRKKGTRRVGRLILAMLLLSAALWLARLTLSASDTFSPLTALTEDAGAVLTLLGMELDELIAPEFTFMERLVLAQSPFLQLPLPRESEPPEATPSPAPEPTPPPAEPTPTPLPTPEGIIGKTMVAGTSAKYVTGGNISIYNHTNYALDIDKLLAAAPELTTADEGPSVLIFHSHATEAYTMAGTDVYEESDSYRTLNTDQNTVRIGAEIAAILESAGITVIHDRTLYDYPSYNDAYDRSSAGVAAILERYPSIRLVIDVHRDALAAEDGTLYKTVAGTVDNCAQVMMVMGTDAMGQSHPNWRVNLSLAVGLQKAMADKWSTLARPIVLRTSRFNQHHSTGEILLEVGTHGNTLQEAITAARLFARTVADMFTIS